MDMEDELFIGLERQLTEVVNVEQQKLLPASVLVLILDKVLLHGVLDLWEDCHYFIECLPRNMTNITIVLGLNGSGTSILTRD